MKRFRLILLSLCCAAAMCSASLYAGNPSPSRRHSSTRVKNHARKAAVSKPAKKAALARVLSVVPVAKPFFSDDMDRPSIIAAYRMNLRYLEKKSSSTTIRLGRTVISIKHAKRTLKHLIALFESDRDMLSISHVINEKYLVYKFKRRGLVTGYFSADYAVSSSRGGKFIYPIPSTKKVKGQSVPLAYASSSKTLGALRLEGSGYLVYEDGTRKLVAVAGTRPYGLKEITTCDFPSTAMDCEPIPGRTVAVDRQFVSLGLPLYLITRKPIADVDGKIIGKAGVARFVAAHDTGGGIKGEGRIDLYFGSGKQNVSEGREMHHPGTVFLLALKPQFLNDPLDTPEPSVK